MGTRILSVAVVTDRAKNFNQETELDLRMVNPISDVSNSADRCDIERML